MTGVRTTAQAADASCPAPTNLGPFLGTRGIAVHVVLAATRKDDVAWETAGGGASTSSFRQCVRDGSPVPGFAQEQSVVVNPASGDPQHPGRPGAYRLDLRTEREGFLYILRPCRGPKPSPECAKRDLGVAQRCPNGFGAVRVSVEEH
jgi:hypothetical protein